MTQIFLGLLSPLVRAPVTLVTLICVVVGISYSVLSILTANFPVRIEKKSLLEFFLIPTANFPVSIKKTKFA